ncbi:MAG: PEGA domain-containing protein [Pseudomonadota bacterium]
MSQFERELAKARSNQLRIYLYSILVLIMAAIVILASIIYTRGTRIDVLPEEIIDTAKIEVSDGVALLTGNTLYSLFSEPAIIVSAEGFYDRQQTISDEDFGQVVTVSLKTLPANVSIRTALTDNQTKWLINNQLYIESNELIHELEAGEYNVTVIHPYYEIKELQLTLSRGEQYNKVLQLTPVTGELNIKSQPESALLSINKQKTGFTPLQQSINGGKYDLTIALENYEPINETIEITREKLKIERDYRLLPEKGQLVLGLSPAGGKLVMNKIQVQPADSFRLDVKQKHSLTYSKPGFFSKTQTFTVNTKQVTKLNINLQEELGIVDIRSIPAEAMVTIDGKNLGKTPLEISLSSIEQVITFSKAGYRTTAKKILPSSASVKLVNANLVPEAVASLQEAPTTYSHQAGGTLKLYKPNDQFVMGAPRDEPGQRANEFQRQVRLTRPFYAGANEVTNNVYQQYDRRHSGKPDDPVTGITWLDAIQFCNWLSQEEGFSPVYKMNNNRLVGINNASNGYRLLTEAEWEWLARKSNRKKQTKFAWGDTTVIPKNTVNVADESAKGSVKTYVPRYNDGYAAIAPVGSFNQELSGLFDQGGNVSEWLHDTYSLVPPKQNELLLDPFDQSYSDSHVIKGASWRSGTITTLRASYREGLSSVRDDVGFRIGRYLY